MADSARRESGCPVHFIWDGNRPVRLGFLLALAAGMLVTAGALLRFEPVRQAGWAVGGVALVLWAAGQALVRLAPRRAPPSGP
ncbi:MAG: hypothetical protein HY904_08075 [Deltaproteobacteria bacterium]|nr:hypothetical protein [Deltaproteobacteria bacterium]